MVYIVHDYAMYLKIFRNTYSFLTIHSSGFINTSQKKLCLLTIYSVLSNGLEPCLSIWRPEEGEADNCKRNIIGFNLLKFPLFHDR